MSGMWSPSKSPTPTMLQPAGTVPTATADVTVAPFMNHSPTPPPLLSQSKSVNPSLFMSRSPMTLQLAGSEATPSADVTAALLIGHNATSPPLLRHTMSLRQSPLRSCVTVRGALLVEAANAHAAPALLLSKLPPTRAVLQDSATDSPCSAFPVAPLPTSLL